MADPNKINALITALENKFLQAVNKVTSWGETPSDDKIPSEKLVKDSLDTKVDTTKIFKNGVFTTENMKANGTKTTIWNEEDGGGAMIVDGTSNVKAYTGVNEGSDGSNIYVQSYAVDKDSKTGTRININKNGAYYTSGRSTYAFTDDDEILTKANLHTAIDALDDSYYDKDTTDAKFLSIEDGEITLEKQATAETGYVATYVFKQGGTALPTKINIPKDYLLKSGTVRTVGDTPTASETAEGLQTGDKYIDMVLNVKSGSNETDEHIFIAVSDLVEDTTYTADGTTLTLSQGNEFSISQSIVDSWLDEDDVEDTIEDYIESITQALNA